MPRRTLVSDQILEENGVLGEVNIAECPLYLIPLEPDLLSLELEDAFSDLYLRKDPTAIFLAARALMLLQKQTGLFPRILGKGDNAKRLADLLLRMRSEEDVEASADPTNTYQTGFGMTPSSTIDNLIIIDREVDFATPLMTQLTYEGLIDETFGIAHNQTEVDSSVLGPSPSSQASTTTTSASSTNPQNTSSAITATKRKIPLDSTDKLYPTLRDCNFAVIGPLLNRTARRLQSDYESRHKDASISDLKSFVAKLPGYQAEQASLKTHTSLAEEIMKQTRSDTFGRVLEIQQNLVAGGDVSACHEAIEELIARDVKLETVLRCLCLESCVSGGLRPRDHDNFTRLLLHAYGHQHLLTLSSLAKTGLLVPKQANTGYLNPMAGLANGGNGSTDYGAVRKSLKLWSDDVDEQEPTGISYVFSGYAPLSVRLVQAVVQKSFLAGLAASRNAAAAATTPGSNGNGKQTSPQASGWKGFEDILARIKGATVDEVQRGADVGASAAKLTLRGSAPGPKTTVVFFLGGVTFAEVAALRFVGKGLGQGRRIVVATTGVVGGDGVVGDAVERRGFGVK